MNENENKTSSLSQNKLILAHLKQGFPITPDGAYKMFDCMRLAARISDLKKYNNITKVMVTNQYNGKRYASYTLIP